MPHPSPPAALSRLNLLEHFASLDAGSLLSMPTSLLSPCTKAFNLKQPSCICLTAKTHTHPDREFSCPHVLNCVALPMTGHSPPYPTDPLASRGPSHKPPTPLLQYQHTPDPAPRAKLGLSPDTSPPDRIGLPSEATLSTHRESLKHSPTHSHIPFSGTPLLLCAVSSRRWTALEHTYFRT